jgi:hypothetical protein
VAEQRHRAVLEVLDGATVTLVAQRYGGDASDGATTTGKVERLHKTMRTEFLSRPSDL